MDHKICPVVSSGHESVSQRFHEANDVYVFVCVEHGETDDREDVGSRWSGRCCFAVGQNDRDTEAVLIANRKGVRPTADNGGTAEVNTASDRDSPVPGCRFRPIDSVTSRERPGDVLTDVVLKLTFDNTAYVEEICSGAAATGLLPDSVYLKEVSLYPVSSSFRPGDFPHKFLAAVFFFSSQ